MTDVSQKLAAILDGLPISVGLYSRTGRVLGRIGGRMADLRRNIVPSQDPREAARWSFTDARGDIIPRDNWTSARALRGEINDTGLVGSFWHNERIPVRVTCVPTFARDSDVAVVSFLQFLDDATDAQPLQQRLIRELAKAVASRAQAPRLAS